MATEAAAALQLDDAVPWHTNRSAVTRLADALVATTDACGRIANDVLVLARPEIGELAEPPGRGGSSTMPHKANPVLSVLVRRAALAAPALAAQLHLAAAESVDERADGGWHVEWSALATLARRTVVAAVADRRARSTGLPGRRRPDGRATPRPPRPTCSPSRPRSPSGSAANRSTRPRRTSARASELVDAVLDRYRGGTR